MLFILFNSIVAKQQNFRPHAQILSLALSFSLLLFFGAIIQTAQLFGLHIFWLLLTLRCDYLQYLPRPVNNTAQRYTVYTIAPFHAISFRVT